jgi:hypothetical protein
MEHFGNISSAINIWDDGKAPAGQKLVVIHAELQRLSIMDENIQQQVGQGQPVQPPRSLPSQLPGPRIHWMTPDETRGLNEQLRREGSDVRHDENATRSIS